MVGECGPVSDHTRRGVLSALVAGGATGLSGCTGVVDDLTDGDGGGGPALTEGSVETGSVPSYASVIPASDGPVRFTAYDLSVENGHEIATVPDDPTDPLRFDGAFGALAARAQAAFLLGLGDAGFAPEHLGLQEGSHFLGVEGVGVALLPVDLPELAADAESNDLAVRVDEADRLLFRGGDRRVFGATPETFAFAPPDPRGFDPVERVRRVLAADRGVTDRAHEVDETFRTLLSTGDTTGSVACGYAGDGDLADLPQNDADSDTAPYRLVTDGFGGARGALTHLTTANGDPPQPASATLQFPDGEVDEETLTATLGTAGEDPAFVRDGTTVRATATYSWDSLSAFESDGLGAT